MDFFSLLAGNWQIEVVALLIGALISWITKHLLADRPKAVAMVVSILEALEGMIEQLLGEKWAPVYDVLLKAGQAAVDGAVSQEEAYDVAVSTFDTAIKITGVKITLEQRNMLLSILQFVVTTLVQDKAASRSAMRSVRTSLKARGIV